VGTYGRDRFDCWYLCSDEFRGIVHGFGAIGKKVDAPPGENNLNSIRIEAVIQAVDRCVPTDPAGAGPQAVVEAAKALDDADRRFLRNEAQSQPFWTRAKGKLPAPTLAALKARLKEGSAR